MSSDYANNYQAIMRAIMQTCMQAFSGDLRTACGGRRRSGTIRTATARCGQGERRREQKEPVAARVCFDTDSYLGVPRRPAGKRGSGGISTKFRLMLDIDSGMIYTVRRYEFVPMRLFRRNTVFKRARSSIFRRRVVGAGPF